MKNSDYWKNFNLGEELQVAGSFIYNSLDHLGKMQNFHRQHECFEVLYNASVGIERLQKISIILLEHFDDIDQDRFEDSLKTHDHTKLMGRIKKNTIVNFGVPHNRLLSLLSDFYRINRYERFTLNSISGINDDRRLITDFIAEGISTSINFEGTFPSQISIKMIRYFGKTLIKISSSLFDIISAQANRLRIYTTEIESNSKAYKIFLRRDFTFEVERTFKQEILVYLFSLNHNDPVFEYIRAIEPLELDLSPGDYIEFLLNRHEDPSIVDELESRYEDLSSEKRKIRKSKVEPIGLELNHLLSEDDDEI